MILLKRLGFIPAALLLVIAFTSCDDNFNSVGSNLIGSQLDSLPHYSPGITAYSEKLGPVQTNGLPANLLGVYKEPTYGPQAASVLTQLSLSSPNPDFGTDVKLDSVVLDLPFYSTSLDSVVNEHTLYKLDSIYGNSAFKLSVSRSNFFLNDFDPTANFENRQKYYSNQGPVFENSLVGTPLFEDDNFEFSDKEIVYFTPKSSTASDTTKVAPQIRVKLPVDYFQQNIIDKQGSNALSNNNNFQNYFRGLYFKAEAVNNDGSMALLNFKDTNAGITLYYTSKRVDTGDFDGDGDVTEVIEIPGSYKLNFGTNTVNTFSEEFPQEILSDITASSPQTGAKNLYLKGGEGSMAVINLFEDDVELQQLKDNNWLINEASLTFYVNQDKVAGGASEPERVYLYDMDNNVPLYDYSIDPTQSSTDPLNSLTRHSGRLIRNEDGKGVSYKIRITDHINNIINNDSTNVRLGLVVTQNINLYANAALKNPVDSISRVPQASVITPKGTVLYGNLADDISKRIKFNIYYTQTNN